LKKATLLLDVFFISIACLAYSGYLPPDIEWKKVYRYRGNESISNFILTPDMNFMIFGRTWSTKVSSYGWEMPQPLVIKADTKGNWMWTKAYGYDEIAVIPGPGIIVNDGNYIIRGVYQNYIPPEELAFGYLLKINPYGNILWECKLKNKEGARYIIQGLVASLNGGCYIVSPPSVKDALYSILLSVNNEGEIVSERRFDADRAIVEMLFNTYDNNYLMFCTKPNHIQSIIKIDKDGEILFTKEYSDSIVYRGSYCQQTFNDGYICNNANGCCPQRGVRRFGCAFFDKDGNFLWQRLYADIKGYATRINELDDGGFIFIGIADYLADIGILRIDGEGNPLWFKTIGDKDDGVTDHAADIIHVSEDGYYLLGYTEKEPKNEIWIMKLTDDRPDDSINDVAHKFQLSIFPEPFQDKVFISINTNDCSNIDLFIYDLHGRLIKALVESIPATGTHTLTWDGTDHAGNEVPDGIYFIRLQAGEQSEVEKIVKIH